MFGHVKVAALGLAREEERDPPPSPLAAGGGTTVATTVDVDDDAPLDDDDDDATAVNCAHPPPPPSDAAVPSQVTTRSPPTPQERCHGGWQTADAPLILSLQHKGALPLARILAIRLWSRHWKVAWASRDELRLLRTGRRVCVQTRLQCVPLPLELAGLSIMLAMLPSVAIDITPRALAIAASVFLSSAWTCGLGGGSAAAVAAAFARIGCCCNVAIADTIVERWTRTGGLEA